MNQIKVEIKPASDQQPAFPELNGKVDFESLITHVAILEKGMRSGRTSVGLMIPIPGQAEQRFALVQLSARQLFQIAAAARAAAHRFGEIDI